MKKTALFYIIFSLIFVFGTNFSFAANESKGVGVKVFEKANPAVITIYNIPKKEPKTENDIDLPNGPELRGGPNDKQKQEPRGSIGSGFLIKKDGYTMTNCHVVDGGGDIKVNFNNNDNTLNAYDYEYPARIIGCDKLTDVAVIKIESRNGEEFPFLEIENGLVKVGERVFAIGSPYNLPNTFTEGIVSGLKRGRIAGPYVDFIQTDAAINQGNSGSPLLNTYGKVIGVNSIIFSGNSNGGSGGNIGLGFAIPIKLAQSIADELIKNGKITRGWLGVAIQEVTPLLAKSLGLGKLRGVIINDFVKESPAKKAGLKRGDIIVEFDGITIDNLPKVVARTEPGKKVEVIVVRGGEKISFTITVGNMDNMDGDDAKIVLEKKKDVPKSEPKKQNALSFRGLGLGDINAEDRKNYRISEDVSGVLVKTVEKGSKADEAGLKPGDVIIKVDDNSVDKIKEVFESHIELPLRLLVMRGGQTRFIMLMH